MFERFHMRGVIAIIIIIVGFYILAFNGSPNDIKMAVAGLMGTVVGYYFVSTDKTKPKE